MNKYPVVCKFCRKMIPAWQARYTEKRQGKWQGAHSDCHDTHVGYCEVDLKARTYTYHAPKLIQGVEPYTIPFDKDEPLPERLQKYFPGIRPKS